ncbi:hypothetical protein EG327_000748 [Venturia inaequalis]|uniref:Glycosyltransferase 2-like domain-containing protein n=1 Tax=Venturia inaequalis TaxID=5025 RepID=A0A8H3VM36_VENIN|nr:hypothetical protein EG327_000748 [Venturia inaequalis]
MQRSPRIAKHSIEVRILCETEAGTALLGAVENQIAKKCQQAKWLEQPEDEFGLTDEDSSAGLGVLLRRPDGFYSSDPICLSIDVLKAVERLGAVVAFTMRSEIVWSMEMEKITPDMTELILDKSGSILPIAPSRFILIWASSVPNILAHGNDVETTLLGLLWGSQSTVPETANPHRSSRSSGLMTHQRGSTQSVLHSDPATNEKLSIIHAAIEKETAGHKRLCPRCRGIAPKLGRFPDYELPHITIQMPVYKEGLKNVMIPSINSLVTAIKHYEAQGGTASIFVNDDGMQLVSSDQAEARKAFYDLHHIGYACRPPHNVSFKDEKGKAKPLAKDDPAYFERKGQFKKASNMNYCLDFSLRVEEEFENLLEEESQARHCTQEHFTVDEEMEIYDTARSNVVESDGGKTWADGDCRIGELILIIDSDTRVPEDCLIYAALEMHGSPEVALLQHASGIMQVVNNVFENGITYFTSLIYTSIQFAVGSGDCAPFVGHNTFIRWKAIQSIASRDPETGRILFWSESHVSEDFDVSLRLQMAGFIVRLATYHNGGFQEGVSLTIYDELARWEKYVYGCNELGFNPLIYWPRRGPFTKLFLKFLFSNIKITSKMTIFAYIFTYYAIASAIPLTLVNYLVSGWFNADLDQFYLTSWKIFVSMAVVFNVLSPTAYTMLRHRLGQTTFFISLLETCKWTPTFLVFFGGLS